MLHGNGYFNRAIISYLFFDHEGDAAAGFDLFYDGRHCSILSRFSIPVHEGTRRTTKIMLMAKAERGLHLRALRGARVINRLNPYMGRASCRPGVHFAIKMTIDLGCIR